MCVRKRGVGKREEREVGKREQKEVIHSNFG